MIAGQREKNRRIVWLERQIPQLDLKKNSPGLLAPLIFEDDWCESFQQSSLEQKMNGCFTTLYSIYSFFAAFPPETTIFPIKD